MSKTYSNDTPAKMRRREYHARKMDESELKYNTRDLNRLRFERCGGHHDLDWKAYRIYKIGIECRTESGTSHGGTSKTWFPLIPGENYQDQAYRLAANAPDECPILGIKFDYYLKGKGGKLNSMSIQHNPDGSLDWISNEANSLILDKDASRLHREATVANNEGNYEKGKKLRACAQYIGKRERIAA